MSGKTTSISNWLLDAKDLKPGDQLYIYLQNHVGPPPSFQDMRAALFAQYGKDTLIRIYKHGPLITIFIHPDGESRERFDYRCKPHVIKDHSGRVEIENGFEKKLS